MRYYDALSRRLLRRRLWGAGEGAELLTMHRALADPDAPEAAPSPLVLESLLAQSIPWPPRRSFAGLDVGCGYGGVSLRFAETRGGDWLGLTLSPVQAARAQHAARRRNLAGRARYLVRSYDAPFAAGERFDVAFAIESLIHSADKSATLANLGLAMKDGAALAIVDDVAASEAAHAATAAVQEAKAQFQAGWMAPSVPDEAQWRRMLVEAGFEVVSVEDLTAMTRPRSDAALEVLMAQTRARPLGIWRRRDRRAVILGEIGGLALERLYNAGAMRYLLIVARKIGCDEGRELTR